MIEIMRDIDIVIAQLVATHPGVTVEQLKVVHPGADDDGLWFFQHRSSSVEVQLESSNGQCPFLVESDASPAASTARTVPEAIALVARSLGLADAAA